MVLAGPISNCDQTLPPPQLGLPTIVLPPARFVGACVGGRTRCMLREVRVVRNEDRARQTNEGIENLSPDRAATIQIFCECANSECLRLLEVRHDAYRAVRAYPLRFMVAKGHELPEFECTVSEEPGYLVVEKHPGAAADAAENLDARN